MPFPVTILDDFNRSDENPITGWTSITGDLEVVSNECKGVDVGDNFAVIDGYSFGTSQLAQLTLTQWNFGDNVGILLRASNINTPSPTDFDGYGMNLQAGSGNDIVIFTRYIAGSNSGSSSPQNVIQFSVGDQVGFRIVGTTLGLWRGVSGVWTQLAVWNDGGITTGDRVGLVFQTNDVSIDDFGAMEETFDNLNNLVYNYRRRRLWGF